MIKVALKQTFFAILNNSFQFTQYTACATFEFAKCTFFKTTEYLRKSNIVNESENVILSVDSNESLNNYKLANGIILEIVDKIERYSN